MFADNWRYNLYWFYSAVVEITKIMKTSIKVLVINGGNVETNKGVAVNKKLELDPLTLKDQLNLQKK